jgi:hypothetical protein
MSSREDVAHAAASLWGIEPGYWDIFGNYHRSKPDTRSAILRSLGVEADDETSLRRAVESRLGEEWTRITPVTVVISHEAAALPVSIPEGSEHGPVQLDFVWENGERHKFSAALKPPQSPDGGEFQGRRFQRWEAVLPKALPLGYHRVKVTLGELASESNLIVTPDCAWVPPALEQGGRIGGIAAALYGLRSERNWGCGDFTDLESFIDWAADELGVDFIALNPLHAIHNRQPYNTSPYLPNSVFYRNPIYIDVERLDDFRLSRSAQALF